MPIEFTRKRRASKMSAATETAVTATVPRDEIARRAYELYLNRGQEDGHDLEDWLRAEREITARAVRRES